MSAIRVLSALRPAAARVAPCRSALRSGAFAARRAAAAPPATWAPQRCLSAAPPPGVDQWAVGKADFVNVYEQVHLMYNEILSTRGEALSGAEYEAYLERAHVAGWCIELVQAAFLVADDMMDASVTRRGGPCWYRLPEVTTIAINDSFLLLSFAPRLLLKYCQHIPEYTHLLNLFNEVIWMTELGQLLDTTGVAETIEDTQKFDLQYYQKIVHCKTADYTFYLPVACAMSLAGETNPAAYDEARAVCHAIGEFFQIQDDFLDCFGDPEVTGKVGTDIEDSKCTWLVCTALEKADVATEAALREAYIAANATTPDGLAAVETVRVIFGGLGVEQAYLDYEKAQTAVLKDMLGSLKHAPPAAFELVLGKLAGRSK